MTTTLSYDLGKVITLIPGYDPYATAAPGEWFDEDAAQFTLAFWEECLTFSQGPKTGQPFLLEPWERAVVANIWGWKRADGTRRYRRVLIFVPRGNGKSEFAAGMVCRTLFLDDQPGAQIYSAAAKRDQTRFVFDPVKKMITREPELLQRSTLMKYAVEVGPWPDTKVYRAICAEASTEHGGATHVAVIDEVHAHANRELIDVLDTSTGKVPQPLQVYLTTSDYDREGSICNVLHEYASKVRDGITPDSAFLPVIYEATRDDDWTDPKIWAKANPNYGVCVSEDFLRGQCLKAKEDPSFENTFKRLHLNIRTEQAFRWMPMAKWDACDGVVDAEALKGRPCCAGLDVATVVDMAALVLAFEVGEEYHFLPFFWCPEETAERRERKERQPYLTWARQGLLELTPGNKIDDRFIRRRINELGKDYQIQEIAFDPWNAATLSTQLGEEDGFTMALFRQGTISMNEPMKTMMKLVLGKELCHGGHPILRWNASNIAARKDASDNVRPDKEKSAEKIDGIVSAIMALARVMANPESGSVYDNEEPFLL